MSDIVAIATYLNPPEAHVLRGALEAAGIFATVVGEGDYNAGLLNSLEVLVREQDYLRALEIKHDTLKP